MSMSFTPFNPVTWTNSYMNAQPPAPMPTYTYVSAPVAVTPSAPAVPQQKSAYQLYMERPLAPQGLGAGWMQAVPAYNTTNPTQAIYYHGDQPFQSGPTFNAGIANKYAPPMPGTTKAPAAKTSTTVTKTVTAKPASTGTVKR